MIQWIMECITSQMCDIKAWIPVFIMLGGAIIQTIYEENALTKKKISPTQTRYGR